MKKAFHVFVFLIIGCGPDYGKYKRADTSRVKTVCSITANEKGFRKDYAVLINMALPSFKKRMFVVDLKDSSIIYRTWVAHGKGSGRGVRARKFSNKPGSKCTSLGIYRVVCRYNGKYGQSYKLKGLEKNNCNALKRAIVLHGSRYVSRKNAVMKKRIGVSWGCPAVSYPALKDLKPYLKKNTLLWIYC